MGCCSLTFLLLPAFLLLGGVCSESYLQLPLGALSEGRGELSETLQMLLEEKKVKHSWDYNRTEGWGEIMQMSSEVFNCSEAQYP